MNFLGISYPVRKTAKGFFASVSDMDQIRSDLLQLINTTPGERVFLPGYGVALNQLVFEPNDPLLAAKAKKMILDAITKWEPRIKIDSIIVKNSADLESLDPDDDRTEVDHVLSIKIRFVRFEQIREVQELKLEIPLSG